MKSVKHLMTFMVSVCFNICKGQVAGKFTWVIQYCFQNSIYTIV